MPASQGPGPGDVCLSGVMHSTLMHSYFDSLGEKDRKKKKGWREREREEEEGKKEERSQLIKTIKPSDIASNCTSKYVPPTSSRCFQVFNNNDF